MIGRGSVSPRGEPAMFPAIRFSMWLIGITTALAIATPAVPAACCYFSAKNADILQPSQKAFLTWDPTEKVETFTVQPRFEGNAIDFGMVIPTPGKPKLDEMPRDFFKEMAVYIILQRREQPQSQLMASGQFGGIGGIA